MTSSLDLKGLSLNPDLYSSYLVGVIDLSGDHVIKSGSLTISTSTGGYKASAQSYKFSDIEVGKYKTVAMRWYNEDTANLTVTLPSSGNYIVSSVVGTDNLVTSINVTITADSGIYSGGSTYKKTAGRGDVIGVGIFRIS